MHQYAQAGVDDPLAERVFEEGGGTLAVEDLPGLPNPVRAVAVSHLPQVDARPFRFQGKPGDHVVQHQIVQYHHAGMLEHLAVNVAVHSAVAIW